MTAHDDRRRAARHELHVPISVQDAGGGVTRDVSATGVAFEFDQPLPAGAPIQFDLALSHSDMLLHCDGIIVRCEMRDGRVHVAATIDSFVVGPRSGS
jgi:hypothetical protein